MAAFLGFLSASDDLNDGAYTLELDARDSLNQARSRLKIAGERFQAPMRKVVQSVSPGQELC